MYGIFTIDAAVGATNDGMLEQKEKDVLMKNPD